MGDSTGTLFGRRCRLLVALASGSFSDSDPAQNAIEIQGSDDPNDIGLRVSFRVVQTATKEPNTVEIVIYNLSQNSRAALTGKGKGALVVLEAGYVATGLTLLFRGDVRTVDHKRDKADWKTILKCGDGERAIRYARASESFAGPCTVADVVTYCAKQMGLALGNTADQAKKLTTRLSNGWTVHGPASSELDRILRSVGYGWSAQDGVIQILAPGQAVTVTVPDITPETGLVGSPEMGTPDKTGKPPALTYKSLLLAQARPGGRNHVKSERYDGIFRTRKVTHTGDTHGNDWYSEFEGISDQSVAAV